MAYRAPVKRPAPAAKPKGGGLLGAAARGLGAAGGAVGNAVSDIYKQVANVRRSQPVKAKPVPAPITSATAPAVAARRLAPKKMGGGIGQGQTAGQKRSIIAGIEADERNLSGR